MMKKIVSSVLAAGAAAFALASPARAETRPYARPEAHTVRPVSAYQRNHESEWGDLYRARREFYARWKGNARERARFESWYAHRCDELRRG
ncbi:MAG TPA: hypothetical protein VMK66_10870 [Myxococcales bacterium]|nr:hypothetical protein [Myxococcales bacterium]